MADLELAAMEQIAFKRYKVIGMFVGEQHWTVMARDPNHAAKLISEGQGRHAGKREPELAGFKVIDMDAGSTESDVVQEVQKEKGKIQVVS
jgi:hypothetical protein